MIYFCCDERRREAVRDDGRLNGIDFLDVEDRPEDPDDMRQRRLFVHMLQDVAPGTIGLDNIRITGGERIRTIHVTRVSLGTADSPPLSSPLATPANVVVIEVAEPGDFSTYILQLVQPGTLDPPKDFDPVLSAIEFSFKAGCTSPFDCQPQCQCLPDTPKGPDINYLARDYASFRQLMLDRLAVLTPGWTESNPADLGIALVESLAYVADYLSYEQDAVATEAYLRTARRRVSVKRHARLIDYFVHEGANARAWIQVVLNESAPASVTVDLVDAQGHTIEFLTRIPDLAAVLETDSADAQAAHRKRPEVFEPVISDSRDAPPPTVVLRRDHNRLRFYTWGDERCCLPEGATRATLRGALPDLGPGSVLVFVEEKGPLTGRPGDADPSHRQAVRLRTSRVMSDPAGGLFDVPPSQASVPVTEIEWGPEDQLRFPLCISSRRSVDGTTLLETDVSVALGNMVLVDHGQTLRHEPLPAVPSSRASLSRVSAGTSCACESHDPTPQPARFRPRLANQPVTHASSHTLDVLDRSATALVEWPAAVPLPVVYLDELRPNGDRWTPAPDLLDLDEEDKRFVLEVESDGTAYLRFGDGEFVGRPDPGMLLAATYRVGNGTAGNVGREAIAHLISGQPGLSQVVARVWNPLPARGGIDPEPIEEVRQRAPAAFRVQERAVTAADHADIVQRFRSDVQTAAATFRWTGSWRTVFVTADRLAGAPVDDPFERELREVLEAFRMAGEDLEVEPPFSVALDLAMHVCVKPDYFVSDVRNALLDRFSNRTLADGTRGLFHPDNFSFGQSVFLSPFYAAAQAVPGVESVDITTFQRRGVPTTKGLTDGRLDMGRLEIPRLDNDPNFQERGAFTLTLSGGR
jgi:hypothetical protein